MPPFILASPGSFAELKIKGLLDRTGCWRSLREMRRMFNFRKSPAAGEELSTALLTSSQGISSQECQESEKTKCQFSVGLCPFLDLTFPHRNKKRM